eukprot:PLAT1056.1.p1 GENE.PLAT1056.1~~PLAT1056.1.p1  ORF type:complete len:192 (+),score=60.50 PLAT1056.1:37-576(+)
MAEDKAARRRRLLRALLAEGRSRWQKEVKDKGRVAPFSVTPQTVVDAVMDDFPLTEDDVLLDLGCGDGRWLTAAVTRYGCRAIGVELDAELLARATEGSESAGVADRITLLQQDVYDCDVSTATAVVFFGKGDARLADKLRRELPSGARIIAVQFLLPDWEATSCREIEGRKIHFYECE